MANTVSLVSKFLALIDAVYKRDSVTAALDALTQAPEFLAANEVKVMKLSMVGLGTYSRVTGYPAGDITAAWETMTLAAERGRAFTLDRMDNEEMLGLVLGNLISEWMRGYVAPELDAYRFAKYATAAITASNAATPATLSAAADVLAAVDAANLAMSEDEVPEEGRKLYITFTLYELLKGALTRTWGSESGLSRAVKQLESTEIIPVPQTRFYTAITLNAGSSSSAGGFVKNVSTGKDINFLLVHPTAVLQPVKLNQVKYFSPEVNQTSDGHLWQYRLYHDAFVYENKVNGVYVHNKA
jgi:hypothetical protein